MFSLSITIVVFLSLTAMIYAAPSQNVDAGPAKTTACVPASTFNALFDKLSTGSTPRRGFGGVDWQGFTVVEPLNEYGINPRSGNKTVMASSYSGSAGIIQHGFPSSSVLVLEVTSFYFACTGQQIGGGYSQPSLCQIQVIVLNYGGISSFGPFVFDPEANPGLPQNMTLVEVNAPAYALFVQIVGGWQANTTLFLDNVVLVEQNFSCSDT